jgi:hypothetical protein
MSRSFDYRAASLVACANHLNTVQNQAFTKLITYYTTKGDEAMLAKLIQARHLAKVLKITADYDVLYGAEGRA